MVKCPGVYWCFWCDVGFFCHKVGKYPGCVCDFYSNHSLIIVLYTFGLSTRPLGSSVSFSSRFFEQIQTTKPSVWQRIVRTVVFFWPCVSKPTQSIPGFPLTVYFSPFGLPFSGLWGIMFLNIFLGPGRQIQASMCLLGKAWNQLPVLPNRWFPVVC